MICSYSRDEPGDVSVASSRGFCRSWVVPCVLKVRKDIVDGVESVIQVFCGTAVAEELVTICVLDEEVGVGGVITEFGDIVKLGVCTAFRGEAAGLPAGFDAGDDGFERGELCVVEFV